MHNESFIKQVFAVQETGLILFYKVFGKWAIHSFLDFQINEWGEMFVWQRRFKIHINLVL